MPSAYNRRWDRMANEAPKDYGWIGIDSAGIWIKIHPETALADRPWLDHAVALYECNADMGYIELSAYDFSALRVLKAAASRLEYGTNGR